MNRDPDWKVPDFGIEPDRVAGYSTADQPVVCRLFIPLETSVWLEYQSWSDAARVAGVELTAGTRWKDLMSAAAQRGAEIGRPQVGTVDRQTIQLLISTLGAVVPDTSRRTIFALWTGCAGEIDDELRADACDIPKQEDGGNFLADGSYVAIERDINWVRLRSLEAGFRFPVAMWSLTWEFIVAAPIYQDSYYVTCSEKVFETLERRLEVFRIDRECLLPSDGD